MKQLPLDGVRVVDLTMMWAGPFATKLLAEMGADVIKIESSRAWDNIRTLLPQPDAPEPWNSSYYFAYYNRDKRSVTLDLAHPAGRDLLLRLVAQSDVVIENYRADVLDKLDLGYDRLKAARSDVILVTMAGFGKTGPERDNVGYGPIIEMASGLTSLTGYGDDAQPVKCGISYGDPVGGLMAAGAVALGLVQRRRTGEGVWVDLSQREAAATLAGAAFVAASRRGAEPVHEGNRDPVHAPQGCYRAAGVDQWLVVTVRSDAEWTALCGVIGRPEAAGLDRAQRRARHDELDEAIEDWTRHQDPQAAMEALQGLGVPAGRVLDMAAVLADPHLNARGFWVDLPQPRMRRPFPQPASAWRFVEANPTLRSHAPLFGEHNREVLSGLLGVSDAELALLRAHGVIADAPLGPQAG
ncbi:MAG: CaiB/BaiF CoA transferase family protein [Acidimicrobiales bacterium]